MRPAAPAAATALPQTWARRPRARPSAPAAGAGPSAIVRRWHRMAQVGAEGCSLSRARARTSTSGRGPTCARSWSMTKSTIASSASPSSDSTLETTHGRTTDCRHCRAQARGGVRGERVPDATAARQLASTHPTDRIPVQRDAEQCVQRQRLLAMNNVELGDDSSELRSRRGPCCHVTLMEMGACARRAHHQAGCGRTPARRDAPCP